MVYLYYCQACEDGRHKDCEIGHPAGKGEYGGSKCKCHCTGDPLWMSPDKIMNDTKKHLEALQDFEAQSRKSLKIS